MNMTQQTATIAPSNAMAAFALNQKEQKAELDRLVEHMNLSDVFRKKNERGNRASPVEKVYIWNRGTHLIDTPKSEVLLLTTREKGNFSVETLDGSYHKDLLSTKDVKDVVKDYLGTVLKNNQIKARALEHKQAEKKTKSTNASKMVGSIDLSIPLDMASTMADQIETMIGMLESKVVRVEEAISKAEEQQEIDLQGLVESEELLNNVKNPTLKETITEDVGKMNQLFNQRADEISSYREEVKTIKATIRQFKDMVKKLKAH